MRRTTASILLACAALASSGVAQTGSWPAPEGLRQAKAEQAAAEARVGALERTAQSAASEAERLRAEQAAAGQEIEAAEARITAAGLQLQLLASAAASQRRALSEQQRPVSSLLAGLGVMAQQPPLLALTNHGGADEFVKVQILLDRSMPVIRRRSAALSARVAQLEHMEQQASAARAELVAGRKSLGDRRRRFAELEQRALQRASVAGSQALSAGDVALSAGESLDLLQSAELGKREARALAGKLAGEQLPPRPAPSERQSSFAPFPYRLPAAAAVTRGLGSVSASGVRARGLLLATARGTPLVSPGAGTVRFAGPFRDFDGVLIIDHGHGWISLIVNANSTLQAGDRVALGQPIGRALGPIEVELSHNGQKWSPAIIAGSSRTLSN